MSRSNPWDVSNIRRTRDMHLRHARRASEFLREAVGDSRRIWREHLRQHVKAARREHWLLVAQSRAISAGMFQRKTIGAHMRAPRRLVGVAA